MNLAKTIFVFPVQRIMADLLSPFDLLPDEVVMKILAAVGTRHHGLAKDFYHVQSFLRAGAVCKRWMRLANGVTSIDWSLETSMEALSLVNFLLRGPVSLSWLSLYVAMETVTKISLPFMFSAPFQKKIPANVNVFVEDEEDVHDESTDQSEISSLVGYLLSCRAMDTLCVHNNMDSPLNLGFSLSQMSYIRKLVLVDAVVHSTSLLGMLSNCPKIESLQISFDLAVEPDTQVLELVSKSLKDFKLTARKFPSIRIHMPSLVSLETSVEILNLVAPNLQKLTTTIGQLSSLPTGVPLHLRHLCLKGLRSLNPKEYWSVVVRPTLRRFSELESLDLAWETGSGQEKIAVVAMDELLKALPLSLKSFSFLKGFLDVLGYPKAALVAYPNLRSLSVKVNALDLPSFFKVQYLKDAFPFLKSAHLNLGPGTTRKQRPFLKRK
jgi:hypothetical protein